MGIGLYGLSEVNNGNPQYLYLGYDTFFRIKKTKIVLLLLDLFLKICSENLFIIQDVYIFE